MYGSRYTLMQMMVLLPCFLPGIAYPAEPPASRPTAPVLSATWKLIEANGERFFAIEITNDAQFAPIEIHKAPRALSALDLPPSEDTHSTPRNGETYEGKGAGRSWYFRDDRAVVHLRKGESFTKRIPVPELAKGRYEFSVTLDKQVIPIREKIIVEVK